MERDEERRKIKSYDSMRILVQHLMIMMTLEGVSLSNSRKSSFFFILRNLNGRKREEEEESKGHKGESRMR